MMTQTVLGILLLNNLAASWVAPFMAFPPRSDRWSTMTAGPGDRKEWFPR